MRAAKKNVIGDDRPLNGGFRRSNLGFCQYFPAYPTLVAGGLGLPCFRGLGFVGR